MLKILDLLLPTTCILCQQKAYRSSDLCSICATTLPEISNGCARCGASLKNSFAKKSKTCGACMNREFPYDRIYAFFYYQKPIDHLLCALKFHKKLLYARVLGELMADRLLGYYKNRPKPELIIPVPLSYQRLRERGCNQALELAKPIVKKLAIQLNRTDCIRIKNTVQQSSLLFKERKRNIKEAFALKKPLTVKSVAIIDDIFTTGSTIEELCYMLRAKGVTNIDVWCCAKVL